MATWSALANGPEPVTTAAMVRPFKRLAEKGNVASNVTFLPSVLTFWSGSNDGGVSAG